VSSTSSISTSALPLMVRIVVLMVETVSWAPGSPTIATLPVMLVDLLSVIGPGPSILTNFLVFVSATASVLHCASLVHSFVSSPSLAMYATSPIFAHDPSDAQTFDDDAHCACAVHAAHSFFRVADRRRRALAVVAAQALHADARVEEAEHVARHRALIV